jgi:hypothetical protein
MSNDEPNYDELKAALTNGAGIVELDVDVGQPPGASYSATVSREATCERADGLSGESELLGQGALGSPHRGTIARWHRGRLPRLRVWCELEASELRTTRTAKPSSPMAPARSAGSRSETNNRARSTITQVHAPTEIPEI